MKLSASYLQEFDTAEEANRALRSRLHKRAAEENDPTVRITLELTDILDRTQTQIEALSKMAHKHGPIKGFDTKHHFVIAESFDGNVMVKRYSDGGLIIVDRNLFLTLVCYVFYQSRNATYGPKLAAWMLLHSSMVTNEPFPLLEPFYLFAVRLHPGLINDLCLSISFFLLTHELGHQYSRAHGLGFLRVRIFQDSDRHRLDGAVEDMRIHKDGVIYNILVDGSTPPYILLPPGKESWLQEMSADLYACYMQAFNFEDPSHGLNALLNHLCIWQQVLRFLELRESYQDPEEPLSRSHPPSTMRVDSMVHHFEKLCQELDPEFKSGSLGVLNKQYDKLWAASFFDTWFECVEYAFQTIDQASISNPAAGQLDHIPGLFRKFLTECAVPMVSMMFCVNSEEVEAAIASELADYNRTFDMGGTFFMDDLAFRIADVGLSFS